jgi:hypothetical protein
MDDTVGKAELTTERDGSTVKLVLHCRDHYAAMLLYDRIVGELHAGRVKLELVSKRTTEAPADG